MEVPGIRRVRSRTFRGATEISAQFEPATDMALALQQVQNRVAEMRGELPADTELDRRAADRRRLPRAHPEPDRAACRRRICNDYAFYVVRPALARVPGVGRVEVLASDTREIEVVLDPGQPARRRPDRGRRRRRAAGRQPLCAGRPLPAGGPAAPGARLRRSGTRAAEIAQTPVAVQERRHDARSADVAPGLPRRAGPHAPGHRQRPRRGRRSASRSRSAPTSSTVEGGRGRRRSPTSRTRSRRACGSSKVYDLAEFVATAIANVRDAILIGGVAGRHRAAASSCATGG